MFIVEWWRDLENSQKVITLIITIMFIMFIMAALLYGIEGVGAFLLIILCLVVCATFVGLLAMFFSPAEF